MLPCETTSFFFVFFSLIKSGCSSGGNPYEWGYSGSHSPGQWKQHYPHCGGMRQSPIDIIIEDVLYNDELEQLKLDGYNEEITSRTQLINNGHSVQVNIEGDYCIEAGGLPSRYRVAQFHFHWGDADQRGSEHLIDGKHFPMEMHIVHFSTEYANISEAINRPNGLAVLSVFFEIGSKAHPGLQKVIGHLHSTVHKNEITQLEPFSLRSLLPQDVSTFYRYTGSLTTPPCYESVIWTLFKDYVTISEKQISTFRKLLKNSVDGGGNDVLVNDFRPVQPINTRIVETNKDDTSGAARNISATPFPLIFIFFVIQLTCWEVPS